MQSVIVYTCIGFHEYGGISGIGFNENQFQNMFSLFQNYPNPFNPITIIYFNLTEKSNTKLTIYDVLDEKSEPLSISNYKQVVIK